MVRPQSRREFLRHMGLAAAATPFLGNLPSLGFANSATRKQRLVVVFSPNGIVPKNFWPDETGTDFQLKPIMQPFAEYKDQMLILKEASRIQHSPVLDRVVWGLHGHLEQ